MCDFNLWTEGPKAEEKQRLGSLLGLIPPPNEKEEGEEEKLQDQTRGSAADCEEHHLRGVKVAGLRNCEILAPKKLCKFAQQHPLGSFIAIAPRRKVVAAWDKDLRVPWIKTYKS